MTTALQTVEDGADFARLALDCLCEGLYEVEGVLPSLDGISKARFDASELARLSMLLPDVDGHPC